MAIYHTYVRLVPSWKQGRSRDQNTNARKLSERKGSGGTVQGDMKTGALATKKHGPCGSGKIERRSTVRVGRQVWVQRAAHSKRVARKKPIPENRKVKSGGHAHVPAGRTKKTTPKYVREYIGHTACDEIRLSVEFVTVEVLGICRHSCCD